MGNVNTSNRFQLIEQARTIVIGHDYLHIPRPLIPILQVHSLIRPSARPPDRRLIIAKIYLIKFRPTSTRRGRTLEE